MKANFSGSFEAAVIRKFPQPFYDAVLRWKSILWILLCKAKVVLQNISTIPVDRRHFSLKMERWSRKKLIEMSKYSKSLTLLACVGVTNLPRN